MKQKRNDQPIKSLESIETGSARTNLVKTSSNWLEKIQTSPPADILYC